MFGWWRELKIVKLLSEQPSSKCKRSELNDLDDLEVRVDDKDDLVEAGKEDQLDKLSSWMIMLIYRHVMKEPETSTIVNEYRSIIEPGFPSHFRTRCYTSLRADVIRPYVLRA